MSSTPIHFVWPRVALRFSRGDIWTGGRLALLLPLVAAIGLVGCAGGFANPTPPSYTISVSPSSVIIAAGSNATFMPVFTPSLPEGGSVSWIVDEANGGSITGAGVYTASQTPGNYTVTATWTPLKPGTGSMISASAMIEVIPAPQQNAQDNPTLTQASGAVQLFGVVQNAGIAGGYVPFVTSADPRGNVRIRSGFAIPLACQSAPNGCP